MWYRVLGALRLKDKERRPHGEDSRNQCYGAHATPERPTAHQNVRRVWPSVRMAQKMGGKLERGTLLQRALPPSRAWRQHYPMIDSI